MDPKLKKIAVILGLLVSLLGIGIVSAVLWLPQTAGSGWPHVPPPELYVTSQPARDQIIGTYRLSSQTITTNGLAVFQGRLGELELRNDGSFVVTNWLPLDMPLTPHAFVSTTGRWNCQTLGGLYRDGRSQPFWGVVFSDCAVRIDSLAFRGKTLPYSLMMTYGDADEGKVMMFERKR